MNVHKKQNILHLLILLIVGLASIIFLQTIISNSKDKKVEITSSTVKKYIFSNLNFSVEVPEGFKAQDTGITVIFSGMNGKIEVARNGTQFNTLDDYLLNSDNKSNIIVQEERVEKISNYETVQRIEGQGDKSKPKYKIYFIFVRSFVYTLSTDSEALYDDLDQIARSFRYTP